MKILIASNNKHKKEEIQKILDVRNLTSIEILTPEALGIEIEVDENANTLEGNAKLKAEAFSKISGLPVIADDTGLEIELLDKLPGVHSARFAGINANDADNRAKVICMLKEKSEDSSKARFRTVICMIDNNQTKLFEGICEGTVQINERGNNGFGYDPLFVPDGYNITFAEMSSEEKNQISHRSKAINLFADYIQTVHTIS